MTSGSGDVSPSSARRIRDLPGPPSLPLLGNTPQLDRQSMHQTLERWSGRHGDIFRFRIALQDYLALRDREARPGQ